MNKILVLIFILAVLIRFLYFPDNVYFGYDSARDSFAALDILKGDFKIIGPPTSLNGNFFHGVLYYYLIAPVLFLANRNPEAVSAFLRIANACGIFLVFWIGKNLFNRGVGFLSAFLFAISYEQIQYSLMYGHPSLSVISVLIFYLGFSLLFFQNKNYGLIIALIGFGLSVQLELVYGLLLLPGLILSVFFKEKFKGLNLKTYLLALLGFLMSIASFLLAEIKFDFRSTKAIFAGVSQALALDQKSGHNLENFFSAATRLIHDNLIAEDKLAIFLLIALLVIALVLAKGKTLRPKIFFLAIWFFGGLLPNLISSNFSYYYMASSSVAVLILASFLLLKFKSRIVIGLILTVILFNNCSLIIAQNPLGPNSDIIIQPGLLVNQEKKIIDYIYARSKGQEFAVNAVTVPFNVNTTWSYLFEWYGFTKYGYLPVWVGAAQGFPGNLEKITNRSKLPSTSFIIIEPTVGIPEGVIDNFFKEENYFTKLEEEKQFGTIKVQKRKRI